MAEVSDTTGDAKRTAAGNQKNRLVRPYRADISF